MKRFMRMACAGLCAAFVSPAYAHKASDAYLDISVQGDRIVARWDVHLRDLDTVLMLDADDDGRITWGEVRRRWNEIEAATWPNLKLDGGVAHCQPARAPLPQSAPQLDVHSDGAYAVLQAAWQCAQPPDVLRLDYRLFAATDAMHRGIVRIHRGAQAQGAVVSAVLVPAAGEQRFVLGTPSAWQTLRNFVQEGVWHIATGTDHVLFLMALLLPAVLRRAPASLLAQHPSRGPQAGTRKSWQAAPAWRPVIADVLRVVTAFTIAHSITLALSVWGWVSLPSRWVESTIAASVVLAAVNNLRPVVREGRWMLTFCFGLIHGFGFASALEDVGLRDAPLGWSLLGFNAGVELGQLAIVAAFVPLAWVMRGTVFYRRGVLGAGSFAIALLAMLWLIERAADVSFGWLPA